ncbi:MAG: YdcH family protein [Proteobacteria bacterium]|nr:YdcH family protein [Pseudomonadota bacterium]MDA1058993.1 YdcH family protein [Pseudomonadota bacterium]
MTDLATVDIDELKTKHDDLDKVIWKEEKRSLPDEERIATLKKEKLFLKDRIALLQK